jgi:hypothetical protein
MKMFLTSKFKLSTLFSSHSLETETGTAYMWGTTNSKPPNQKTQPEQQQQSILSRIQV